MRTSRAHYQLVYTENGRQNYYSNVPAHSASSCRHVDSKSRANESMLVIKDCNENHLAPQPVEAACSAVMLAADPGVMQGSTLP